MRKTQTILLAVVLLSSVVFADPMGTAFTYQGRLHSDSDPAEGSHDFIFELYDSPVTTALPIGPAVTVEDVEVTGGYFTVKIDFGVSMFTGAARWLSISVRPGDSTDPLDYETLDPRQEITPTPNAIFAATAGGILPPVYLEYTGVEPVVEVVNNGGSEGVKATSGSGVGVHSISTGTGKAGVFENANTLNGLAALSGINAGGGEGVYGRTAGGKSAYGIYGENMSVDTAGGLGASNAGVYGSGGAKYGVYGRSDTNYAVYGNSVSNYGVYGYSGSDWGVVGISPNGSNQAGVVGAIKLDNGGIAWIPNSGVSGSTESGYGVAGRSKSGTGVYGKQDDSGNYGYLGGAYAVYGRAYGDSSVGVYGYNLDGHAVKGYSGSHYHAAVYGENDDGFGVYGLHTSPSWTSPGVYGKNEGSGAGVLGRSMEAGQGVIGEASKAGGTGVRGTANHAGSVGIHGEGKYGADAGLFEGDVVIKGELEKEYTTGNNVKVTPVAFGTVSSAIAGTTIRSGSGNFSVVWTGDHHEITISGVNYHYTEYTAVVTPLSGSPVISSTSSVGGKLLVYLYNTSGTKIRTGFQFVVYKGN